MLEKVLQNIDHDTCNDLGNFYQVLKDGELLGYVIKEGWQWKPKTRAK